VRDANIEYEIARAEYLANRFSRLWTRSIFVAAAALWTFAVPGTVSEPLRAGVSLEGLGIGIFTLFLATSGVFLWGLAITPKRTVAMVTRGTPENTGFLRGLWGGTLGSWFFKLAGIGLSRGKALPVPDNSPTEVLLCRGMTDLFEQLPKEQRARFGRRARRDRASRARGGSTAGTA
jgi:hypothetical protein